MKKEYRVKRNEDYSKIISKRNSVANQAFIVYSMNNGLDHARVGISVSKKLGNAVVRNKLKRQIRAMTNELMDFERKNDYIIIARKGYLRYNYNDNKNLLNKLFNKINKKDGKKC